MNIRFKNLLISKLLSLSLVLSVLSHTRLTYSAETPTPLAAPPGPQIVTSSTPPASAAPSPPPEVKIVVIPLKTTPKAPYPKQIAREVEDALGTYFTVIPFISYAKLASRQKILAKNLANNTIMKNIGGKLHLTHAAVIKSIIERQRAKPQVIINVQIVNLANQEILFNKHYPFTKNGLSPDVLATLPSALKTSIYKTPKTDNQPKPPTTPIPVPKTPEPLPRLEKPVEPAKKETKKKTESISVPADHTRPLMRLSLGAGAFQRIGELSSKTATSTNFPCYCVDSGTGEQNPLFMAFKLGLETFPLMVTNPEEWYSNIGLYGDATFSSVKTLIDASSNYQVTSTVQMFNVGCLYRLALFESPTAPDIFFKAGYFNYSFPLPNDADFPTIAFGSVYGGASFVLHLGQPIALFLGGDYHFLAMPSSTMQQFGKLSKVMGIRGEGGLRVNLKSFELAFILSVAQYNLDFHNANKVTIGHIAEPLTDITSKETLFSGFLTAAYVLSL